MNFKFEKCKTLMKIDEVKVAKVKHNISKVVSKYGKVVGISAIVFAMVVACLISFVQRKLSVNDSMGIVVSMTNVAEGTKPFGGKSFDAEILEYGDMIAASEAAAQQAEIDKTREQVDAIIASVEAGDDKSDSGTLGEKTDEPAVITSTQPSTTTIVYADGSTLVTTAGTTTVTTTSSGGSPSVSPTYASTEGAEDLGEYLLTGYCACPICCGAWSNIETPITASGAIGTAGRTVAVDTSIIAFGTRLVINGQVYVAEDRGSAIKGNHIDIFFATHEEALAWGKRYAHVYRLPD